MKKKALILVSLYAFSFFSWKAQATNTETNPLYNVEFSIPHGIEDIELFGSLMLNVGPNAIEAGASDDAVYIQFNQSFGNVSIAIFNSNGQQIYSTTVNSSIQQVVIIPFITAATDAYTIVLDNATGYAEGDFEKN